MSSRFEQKRFARHRRLSFAASCIGLSALFAQHASAQTEDIRIEYRALAGCPSAEEFNAEVFKRTSSARLAAAGAEVRTFVVEIEQRRGTLTGSLRVREGRGETVAREVQGERCSEVASALALATALAIDPNASFEAREAQPGNQAENATDKATPSSPAAAPQKPKATAAAEPSRLDPGTERSAVASEREWSLALGPSLLVGVTPRAAMGGSLSAQRTNSSSDWWSSFGIELTLLRGLESESAGARAAFQFVYARPELCSVRLGAAEGFSLSPCVAAELGALSGWGSDIPREESHTKLWAAADALIKLRFVRPSSWLVEAEAGAVFPFTRYDFEFLDPKTPIYSVPAVAFAAGFRIGVPLRR